MLLLCIKIIYDCYFCLSISAGDPASYFAQQKQEASKGRGVMGSVLPLYAVGIVIYFAYIMYRVS